jgi:hypothetical protein
MRCNDALRSWSSRTGAGSVHVLDPVARDHDHQDGAGVRDGVAAPRSTPLLALANASAAGDSGRRSSWRRRCWTLDTRTRRLVLVRVGCRRAPAARSNGGTTWSGRSFGRLVGHRA